MEAQSTPAETLPSEEGTPIETQDPANLGEIPLTAENSTTAGDPENAAAEEANKDLKERLAKLQEELQAMQKKEPDSKSKSNKPPKKD